MHVCGTHCAITFFLNKCSVKIWRTVGPATHLSWDPMKWQQNMKKSENVEYVWHISQSIIFTSFCSIWWFSDETSNVSCRESKFHENGKKCSAWPYTYHKICENVRKMRKMKSVSRIFRVTFFRILHPIFASGLTFARKVKGFCALFFRGNNKTQNLHEIRKVNSECFVFCGVSQNTRKMWNMKSV